MMDQQTSASRESPVPLKTFQVDDVSPSRQKLPTSDLLSALGKELSREVVVTPLSGRVTIDNRIQNPLVSAVDLAFRLHLPLTLSPDAIWLTIVQGFSHHINQNAEAFRGRLVRHQGSLTLVQRIAKLKLHDVTAAVSGFSRQIRESTDPALHDTLVCDFSTTTLDARVASEVALMDTYSRYFKYEIRMCICGIPSVTLTGTVDDWQRILHRLKVLETFGLDWWVNRLRPILREFLHAAEGRPDVNFWRGIYKFRPVLGPYHSEKVTGWLVDLFPYLGDAPNRERNPAFDNDGPGETFANAFPSGLCSVAVELKLVDALDQVYRTEQLELVAGLVGVEQNRTNSGLSPLVGWLLARHPPAQKNIC